VVLVKKKVVKYIETPSLKEQVIEGYWNTMMTIYEGLGKTK